MVDKKEFILVKLDPNYCNYLRKYDSKVPYNFNNKIDRPFVGILFKVKDIKYFAPLSSPKIKHLKLRSKLDLLKIDNGKLGVVNFNNMLPVSDNNIAIIDINKQPNSIAEGKYFKLLGEQVYWLNRNADSIHNRAKTLYSKYLEGTLNSHIKERCCNFPLLEEKCLAYNKM